MSCDAGVFLPVERWCAAMMRDARRGPVAHLPFDLDWLPALSVASSAPPLSRVGTLHAVLARTEQWLCEWAPLQDVYDPPLLLALRIDGALQALLLARAPSIDSDGHVLLVQLECVNEHDPPQLVVHGRNGAAHRLWSITSSPPCASASDCALHMLVHIVHFHYFRRAEQCLCDSLQKAVGQSALLSLLDAIGGGGEAVRSQQAHASRNAAPFMQVVLNDVLSIESALTLYQFAEAVRERVHATALHTGSSELSEEQRFAIDCELDELRNTLLDSPCRLPPERTFALVLASLRACTDPACAYACVQPYAKVIDGPGLQLL